jgi:hypothetical protein
MCDIFGLGEPDDLELVPYVFGRTESGVNPTTPLP